MSRYKDKLKYGDWARIADITGYSKNYVTRVLSRGDRKNDLIESVAENLINHRDSLKTECKK